ncbi:uncharacterized protein F5Z01DRAFT_627166 [Emericellopsis atlantica]|uniref:Zn(2)-C6 fungal-type domain-containing protein n=1 Tax=Emericellopsis atlantica TaxID=2614577 RepID=A0A9P8CM01_9HYPO|nr:uncharacterized protein F5Z01DRAFT_627166 [Emericellopsis atlantica]KAG9251562.1 hypothetical protein F5Z01DRAFT_627166 [Emericellopsis atlantica]
MSETTAPSATDQSSAAQDDLKIWSCVNCRRRKLRCERREPCSNCVRSKIECHFPVTGRIPRRSRDATSSKNPAQKQAELMGRLRRLEAVVTEMAGQMEDGADEADAGTPNTQGRSDASASWQKHNDPTEDFGNLVTESNGGLRVAKGFWSIFCTEVDNIFQAVADVEEAAEEHADVPEADCHVDGAVRSHHQGFVLGSNVFANTSVEDDLSPLPSQMLFIWQVFCDNVDPFVKILDHAATTKTVQGIKGKLHALDPETEALMFAVSLAAIVSLDEEEAALNFGVSKPRLLARLRLGAEKALASAKFMTTGSIAVVQAFVIYVTILPQLGAAKLAGPMTSILVRRAISMGLHRDPAADAERRVATVSADHETRRRLWWHVCVLDSRVRYKDVPELSVSPSTGTTREPCSGEVNEPSRGAGFTHVTVCLIRCELWRLSHTLRNAAQDSGDSQQQLLPDARARICETYFAEKSGEHSKLQEFVYHLVLLFFSQVQFAMCRRQMRLAQGGNQEDLLAQALDCAATLMDTTMALKTCDEWKCWRWQLQGHVPWSAMLFTLQALRRGRPWNHESKRAWASLQQIADTLGPDEEELPICQNVKRHIEDLRNSDQHAAHRQSGVSETQPSQNSERDGGHLMPGEALVDSKNASSLDDGAASFIPSLTNDTPGTNSARGASGSRLQMSWEAFDFGADSVFNWDPLLEMDDAMDWQWMDAGSDLSFADWNTLLRLKTEDRIV